MGQRKTTIQTGTWSPSWGYSLQASASMAQYPTNQNRSAGTNYWITGSAIIPTGVATFTTSSLGLGPANTTAKVSIPVSHFSRLSASPINDTNDVRGFNILTYNGIISTLPEYNEFSSSISGTAVDYTISNFVVIHVSASKANMGSVVGNDLYVTLGTTQNSSATRNGNDSTTNVSGHAAFAAKYPNNTTKAGWVSNVSPKNQ